MKNIVKNLLVFVLIFLSFPVFYQSVQAAYYTFDKTTVTVANGTSFQIAVAVDPGSDSLNSTDAYVTYDSTLLKATAVAAGTLFPTVTNDVSTSGKVYISGMVDDPASAISTAGTVATITFQGLKDGSGTLAFDCNSSKIIKNDINASNVIVCGSNGTSAVTIGGSSGSTSTTDSEPAAVTELPQSGVFENVAGMAIPGMIILIIGLWIRLVL